MSKAKQAILRAIAIKLEVETHKKYRKVLSKIFGIGFLFFLAFGTYNAFKNYQMANDILENPGYAEATVEELEYISDEESKYRYTFTANEQSYSNDMVINYVAYNDNYGDEGGLNIAYNKTDPNQSNLASRVKKNSGFSQIIIRFVIMFFLGGLAFVVVYTFFTYGIVQPTEDYEDEEDENEDEELEENKDKDSSN